MGQDQSQHKIIIPKSSKYEIDPRLIDFTIELPSSFSFSYQRFIDEIQTFLSKVPQHERESYTINSIDQYFSRYINVDEQAFHKEKSIYEYFKIGHQQFADEEWTDLRTKDHFLQLICKFNQQYYLQLTFDELLKKDLDVSNSTELQKNVITLRKPIQSNHENNDFMDEDLLKRLFYGYYINVFKSFGNSSRKKEALMRFHEEVGWLLCKIVSAGYFSAQKLFQLVYCTVYLDKTGLQPINQLEFLRSKYSRYCLQKKHSIGIDLLRLENINRATRLYLDELYLCSMKQAQDPQINPDSDSLIPAKSFPVQRAKQRSGR